MKVCGERGIRTPGPLTVNGFQDRRNRPLCQLSAAKVRLENLITKRFEKFIETPAVRAFAAGLKYL